MVAAFPALLVLAVLLNVRRTPSIRVRVVGEVLVVELVGLDAVYCARRRVEVSVDAVEGVGVYERAEVPTEGLRLPGTSVPGVIRAGSYGTGASRDFWDVRTGRRVLVIGLRPGAEYRRIVLEVARPEELLAELQRSLGPFDRQPITPV